MSRRLTPEARRAEIVATARELITEEGYRSLSLREVARRCGMSTPGLMHHFPDMPSLLHAVLESRDDSDMVQISLAVPDDATLDDLIEAAAVYYADDPSVRAFDALEREAIDPSHPAHQYFVDRDERVNDALRVVVEREFEDPERAFRVLRIVMDGLRLRRMRDPESSSIRDAWCEVRDAVYAASPRRSAASR